MRSRSRLTRFATAFEQEALAAFTEGAKASPQTANNYTFRAIRTAIERSYGITRLNQTFDQELDWMSMLSWIRTETIPRIP